MDMYRFFNKPLDLTEGTRVRIYLNYSWSRREGPAEFPQGTKKLRIREGEVIDSYDWKVPTLSPKCEGGFSLLMHVSKMGSGYRRKANLGQADYIDSYLWNNIGRLEVLSSR